MTLKYCIKIKFNTITDLKIFYLKTNFGCRNLLQHSENSFIKLIGFSLLRAIYAYTNQILTNPYTVSPIFSQN